MQNQTYSVLKRTTFYSLYTIGVLVALFILGFFGRRADGYGGLFIVTIFFPLFLIFAFTFFYQYEKYNPIQQPIRYAFFTKWTIVLAIFIFGNYFLFVHPQFDMSRFPWIYHDFETWILGVCTLVSIVVFLKLGIALATKQPFNNSFKALCFLAVLYLLYDIALLFI